jgi:hypothetical protein
MRICERCGWENPDPQTDDELWCRKCNNFLGFPDTSRAHERRIVLRLVDSQASVLPGGEASLTARVRNGGDVVERVIFSVEGPVDGWARVEPDEVGLFPNQESEVKLVLGPPRTSEVGLGLTPFRLVARSESDARVSDSADGTVDVGPFVEVKASLVPVQSAGPSGAEHRLLVDNAGNGTVDVRIDVTQPGNDLTFAVTPPSVHLGAGASGEVRIAVAPREPLYGATERRYPFAVSIEAPGQAPIAWQAVHVQQALTTAPTLVLADSRLHAAPGEEATTTVTVRNRGRGGDDYSVELLGPSARWGRVVPPTVLLPSAGEVTVTLVIVPPLEPLTPAGDVPFAVRCFSPADGNDSTVVEGLLTVDPTSEIDFEVVPDRVRGRWSSRHVIEVENRGNAAAHLRPLVVDPEHELSFAVSPWELQLPASSSDVVVFKARARRPRLFGKARKRSFQVQLSPASRGARISSRGEGAGREVTFQQISVLPRKLAALVAVLAVIGALVGAAFAFLGSQIHSLLS